MKYKFILEIADGIDPARLIFFRAEINFTWNCEVENI